MLRALALSSVLNGMFMLAIGEALMPPPRVAPTAAHWLLACVEQQPPRPIGYTPVGEYLRLLWFNARFNEAQRARFTGEEMRFGNGVVGLDAAAQHWFHKDAVELTAGESLLLVALPRSSRLGSANVHRLTRRARHIAAKCL